MGHIGTGTKDILLWKKINVFPAGVMENAQKLKSTRNNMDRTKRNKRVFTKVQCVDCMTGKLWETKEKGVS